MHVLTCSVPFPGLGPRWYVGKHAAPIRGVQGRLRHSLVINTLYNVDFSIVRPSGLIGEPPRRPNSTACGHMPQVEDEQTTIVACLSLQTDRFTWSLLGRGRRHVDEGFAILFGNVGNVELRRPLLRDVVVVSSRSQRIRSVVEFVIVKERRLLISRETQESHYCQV